MSDAAQELSSEEDASTIEYVMSICWDSGVLSVVYYNLTTLELHVSFKHPVHCVISIFDVYR